MNLLDCTLRDGGYYNSWNFTEKEIEDYLYAVSQSGVRYVELGLRNFEKEGFLGAFAYTPEEYLNALDLPRGLEYGVMVDAKTILSANSDIQTSIEQLFVAKQKSKLTLVRIAAHFEEVELSEDIAKTLKSMGYVVGFNLMQAGGKSSDIISEKAKIISSWGTVDVLYFADSLGNMDAEEVGRITKALRSEWALEIGIHTHNNMGKALENSLVAKNEGALWLDCTVTGMGRGAGNTLTEELLTCLAESDKSFNPEPIYELVIKTFAPLKEQYKWGGNLLYFLGAKHNVHPTYIQTILSNPNLGKDEIASAISFLSRTENTHKFDGKVLELALSLSNEKGDQKGDVLSPKFQDREVLILANTDGAKSHIRAINQYIKKHKPIVVSINLLEHQDPIEIDYCCISHNLKFSSEHQYYSDLDSPLIYPKHRFKDNEIGELRDKQGSINYGVQVSKNTFKLNEDSCVIPFDLTIAYALAVVIRGGASRVLLAGFDGYLSNDERQREMIDLFQMIKEQIEQDVDIVAVTPTSYPIVRSSIYGLL